MWTRALRGLPHRRRGQTLGAAATAEFDGQRVSADNLSVRACAADTTLVLLIVLLHFPCFAWFRYFASVRN